MNIRQIRNATIVVQYAGKKFLIDPVLADRGTYPPFGKTIRQDQLNPIVNLPIAIEQIINVDAVIVTHLHLDHIDPVAKKVLPKDIKMFLQNEEDANVMREDGFTNVEVLKEDTVFEGIQLTKTTGQHGRGEVLKLMGNVCGVIFKHPDEQTLYLAGDTVWYNDVQEAIETHKPEIIVVNGGGNQGGIPLKEEILIMGKDDIFEVYKAAPKAKIIVSHMEAMNHWTLARSELKNFIKEKGISANVLVPEDGESFAF